MLVSLVSPASASLVLSCSPQVSYQVAMADLEARNRQQ